MTDLLAPRHLGLSRCSEVSQETITAFAELTGDRQYVHLDERMASSRFGGTLAHGYLLLALFPAALYDRMPELVGRVTFLNGGLDQVRLTRPVTAGSRLRFDLTLAQADFVKPRMHRMLIDGALVPDGGGTPVLTARIIIYVEEQIHV
jgi:acyl dehydratase